MGDRERATEEYRAGSSCHDQRDFENAVAHYRRAIECDPDYEPVYNDLSAALFSLGRHDEALPVILRAHEGRPRHAPTLGNLIACLHKLQRFDEARERLDQAMARGLNPKRDLPRSFVMKIADVLWVTGAKEEALPLYEWAFLEYPDNYLGRLAAGDCSYYIRRYGDAIEHFKWAHKAEPGCETVCFRLAQCYLDVGLPGMAAKYARMARERDPSMDLGPLGALLG